jgi:ubiquinone/menaquinone biosynthesis C-methylase UbiE
MNDRRPSQRTTIGIFSRAAASYNTVGPRHFTAFARRLVEATGVRPGDRVLDVGTGSGEALLAASERSGAQGWALGVDLTPAMLARAATTTGARHGGTVHLGAMDAEQLALAGGVFDVVLCAFALSSFTNADRALVDFARVLRPGGRVGLVHTTTWYFQHDPLWRWHEEALRDAGVFPPGDTAAALPDDRTALVAALRRAGFSGVRAVDAAVDLAFRDEAEWWRWSWSHGTRRLFESVPPDRLDDLRQRLFRGLRQTRGPDGHFHGTMRAAIVNGQKAPV